MNQQIKNDRKMIYCEICSYKRIIESDDNTTDLTESKTSKIQVKLPNLDHVTGKITASKFVSQPKRYKCPQCGRVAKVRELVKPFADALKLIDEEKLKKQREEDLKKRIEDGKMPEKKIDPDFLG